MLQQAQQLGRLEVQNADLRACYRNLLALVADVLAGDIKGENVRIDMLGLTWKIEPPPTPAAQDAPPPTDPAQPPAPTPAE